MHKKSFISEADFAMVSAKSVEEQFLRMVIVIFYSPEFPAVVFVFCKTYLPLW